MKGPSRVWMGLTAVLACSGCAQEGYEVRLEVTGPPAAFSGRTLEVQGITAPAARVRTGHTSLWTTEVVLCTRNREAFLSQPLRVRVLEGEQVREDRQVRRTACRSSGERAGEREHDILYLGEDGMLVTDFGEDSRTEAVCYPPDAPIPCPKPDF
ncbi:hypothetical protein [Archangium primigenium]|uniref:hypothetical protein n=1 Tax=[Archangium] primigenium TaxID=2792470 RepID=UPI0019584EC9|nr:hypothetical protein [Archangium primigenium]MBM7118784.1 hypothetical protein [Archangium primigenium]